MIEHLSLTNFQKHRHFEHAFDRGLTVCFGPNWAGKSTLQRAILYALFGTSAVPVKAANLVTHGEKAMEVTLRFRADDRSYTVTRGTRGAALRLLEDGVPRAVAAGHTAVTDSIEALIGSAKDLLHFQTVRQGDAASLLTLGSTKLGEHLNRVTGVDLVDRVLSKIRLEIGRLDGAQDAYQAAQGHVEQLTDAYHRLLEESSALLEPTFEVELGDLRQMASRLAAELAVMRAQAEQFAKVEALRTRIDAELERIGEVDVVETSALDDLDLRISELHAKQARHELTSRQRRQLEGELANANQILAAERPVIEPDALVRADEQVQARRKALHLADAAALAAVNELDSGICRSCQRPFEGKDRAELEWAVEAAKDRKQAALDELKIAELEHATLLELHRAAELFKTWEAYKAQVEAELEALGPVEAFDPDLLSSLRAEQDRLRKALAKQERIRSLKRERSALPIIVPADVEPIEKQHAQVTARMTECLRALDAHAHQVAVLNQRLEEAGKQLEQAKQHLVIEQARAQRLTALLKLSKYLRSNRDRFTQHAWDQVLAFASTFVQEATGGDITALLREGDEFLYEEQGERRPIELASGLQSAILGVAIKLALAAAVGSRFEVMLFDEVSAGAQDENSLRLTECLSRVAGQVFLISHREMDASVARQVLSL